MNWIYFWLRSVLADGQVLQRSGNTFVGVAPDALSLADHVEPASNNAYDLGITGTRWRTAYLGTALDAPKWTYAGAAEIDLTGAATRILTVRNSTSSQVAEIDLDGTYYFRNGTAYTARLLCTPSANRVITFPDASITVASLGEAETFSGVKTFSADPVFSREAAHVLEVAASTAADTAGGALTVKAGDGGATNANGGACTLDAGAKAGSGTDGVCNVGTVNAEGVFIGRTGKTVLVNGNLEVTQAAVLLGAVGVGAGSEPSAALAVTSTTGGLLFPRMTEAQRDAIGTPLAGLVVYNTDTNKLNLRVAAGWEVITSA